MRYLHRLPAVLACVALILCQYPTIALATRPAEFQPVSHPEWSRNASIYEVNIRQYSPGGTFAEFEEHLPRLKDMGVDILWLMPIHPIGEQNRKGTLGSYYSVKDYRAVNPEFGTMADFEALVKRIHNMGMYVIIDWVANHSAWDNPLTLDHPDWFARDVHGNFVPPNKDWTDVIDIDFSNPELRRYMIDAMKFWVEEVGIDGFRCDVAGMVPIDFWNAARAELDEVKPVFMLAEWESPEHHQYAFDMTYAWGLHDLMKKLSRRTLPASALGVYLEKEAGTYPEDAYRMYFTSNHDLNSWDGTVSERLGSAGEVLAVMSATLGGMPLIYSGQEAGLDRQLAFFEKDEIVWKEHRMAQVYSALFHLKHHNRALWNGASGGGVTWVHTSNDGAVFAFVRERAGDKVFVVLNLSDTDQKVELTGSGFAGGYAEVLTANAQEKAPVDVYFAGGEMINLSPWDYRVYTASER
ncbi:MAG: alpha-amylase family glycosyl hydrolase [Candidatus Eisenbacteria bacterium]